MAFNTKAVSDKDNNRNVISSSRIDGIILLPGEDQTKAAHDEFIRDLDRIIAVVSRSGDDTTDFTDPLERDALEFDSIGGEYSNDVYNLGVQAGVIGAVDILIAQGYTILDHHDATVRSIAGSFAEDFFDSNWNSISS